MIGETKKNWEDFKESEPGKRFMKRYRQRQKGGRGWADPSRLFYVILGTLLVLGSAFFGWAPGPGMLTFVIGLGMIAGEFRFAARLLDWAEVRARKFWRFVTAVWHNSAGGKVLVAAAVLALSAATAYGVYFFLFRG